MSETPAVVDALEAPATPSGEVEAPPTEEWGLAARLASEQARAARLERQLRELEQERELEVAAVRATYQRLVEALQSELARKDVALREATGRLSVSIVDRVLFPSGQATLTLEGRRVMDKVSDVLTQAASGRVLIEGHTDDVPIGASLRRRFTSNWELSTARAAEVVKYLVERGFPSEDLTAAGRADTAPIASNETEAGRRQNRRIEIVLLPPESPGPVRHDERTSTE